MGDRLPLTAGSRGERRRLVLALVAMFILPWARAARAQRKSPDYTIPTKEDVDKFFKDFDIAKANVTETLDALKKKVCLTPDQVRYYAGVLRYYIRALDDMDGDAWSLYEKAGEKRVQVITFQQYESLHRAIAALTNQVREALARLRAEYCAPEQPKAVERGPQPNPQPRSNPAAATVPPQGQPASPIRGVHPGAAPAPGTNRAPGALTLPGAQ